jgi:hypothetical protein
MSNKKNYVVVASVFCLAVVALMGIAYASFTQQLTINGTGTVTGSKWSIYFTNVSEAKTTGTVGTVTAPKGTGTTALTDFVATLSKPGSSVTYTFDVVNAGNYDAKIGSVTIPTPTCTGTGDNADTDATNVCNYVTYTLTYADGTKINTNDTLNAGETKSLKLTLSYSDFTDETKLPSNDVTISNLQCAINYVQA